jgi:DNA repair protein RadC
VDNGSRARPAASVEEVNRTLLADLDPDQRPRERLLRHGPDALSDAELVALLLGSGRRGRGAVALAEDLLAAHGGLPGLSRTVPDDLTSTPGVGPAKSTRVVAALALARRFGTSTDRRDTLRTPADVARIAGPLLDRPDDPRLAVVVGDRAGRLLGAVALPAPLAHDDPPTAREVLAETLRRGGVTLALAHRHAGARAGGPGADPGTEDGPTHGDLALTRAVVDAAALCGVRLLDHLVLGPTGTDQHVSVLAASGRSGQ